MLLWLWPPVMPVNGVEMREIDPRRGPLGDGIPVRTLAGHGRGDRPHKAVPVRPGIRQRNVKQKVAQVANLVYRQGSFVDRIENG